MLIYDIFYISFFFEFNFFVSFLWHLIHKVLKLSNPHNPPPLTTGIIWSASHNPPPCFFIHIFLFKEILCSFKKSSLSFPSNKIAFLAIYLVSILHKAQIALSLL